MTLGSSRELLHEEAYLTHLGNGEMTIGEGEIFDAVITIRPPRDSDFRAQAFREIEGRTISDSLYIADVKEVRKMRSLNDDNDNDDDNSRHAFQVSIMAVLRKAPPPSTLYNLKIDGHNIVLKIKNINFKKRGASEPLGFVVYDQDGRLSFLNKRLYAFYIVSSLTFASLAFLILYKKIIYNRKNNLLKKIDNEKLSMWSKKFLNARSRDNFEEVYFKKDEWMGFVKDRKSLVDFFLNKINEHQYKEEWSSEELDEVENSFSKIKQILKC